MRLRSLYPKEWLLLGLRAERQREEILALLREEGAYSQDAEVLAQWESNQRNLERLKGLYRRADWPLVWHLCESEIGNLLSHHVPTLFHRDGFRPRNLRSTGRELCSFYRRLAETAAGELSHEFEALAEPIAA